MSFKTSFQLRRVSITLLARCFPRVCIAVLKFEEVVVSEVISYLCVKNIFVLQCPGSFCWQSQFPRREPFRPWWGLRSLLWIAFSHERWGVMPASRKGEWKLVLEKAQEPPQNNNSNNHKKESVKTVAHHSVHLIVKPPRIIIIGIMREVFSRHFLF